VLVLKKQVLIIPVIILLVSLLLTSTINANTPREALPVNTASTTSITIDGDPGDWGVFDCTSKAPGLYLTTINNLPQWIWCDPPEDERTDFSKPDRRVDLIQFRITADGEYLYGLIIVKDMDFTIGDNGGTFVAIAINRNGTGVGEWFAGYSDTRVNNSAKWMYQVVVNLADSRYKGRVERV